MIKNVFIEIVDLLQDINYFFISGTSVAIHTKGKRIPGDIDLVIHSKDIHKFAKRVGGTPATRKIDKGSFWVNDYGFEIVYKGQEVECTTGYPQKRMDEDTIGKLFKKKLKLKYLDKDVYVEPPEELVNQKAFMGRPKDMDDLVLLKDIVLNKNLFYELSNDKGNLDTVLPIVQSYFKLK